MRQLTFLEGRYELHVVLNQKKELAEMKEVPKRDYYNVRKVRFYSYDNGVIC